MKKFIILFAPITVFAIIISITCGNAEASETFFKGKKIKMVVPFGPGGGVDTWTRTVARAWGKFIPGNPTFIVVNRPGAGGGLGFTILYKRTKPDGLTLITGSAASPVRWLAKVRGHENYESKNLLLISLFILSRTSFQRARVSILD